MLFAAAMGLLLPLAVAEVVGAIRGVVLQPYRSDFVLYNGVSTIGLHSGFAHIYGRMGAARGVRGRVAHGDGGVAGTGDGSGRRVTGTRLKPG